MKAIEVFAQQDGSVTKAYYAELDRRGPAGQLATALFRAQKRSTAAKKYRGRRFTSAAYDVKNWSLSEICRILTTYGEQLKLRWGWKDDFKTAGFTQVLYVDLPQGQCSFHSASRLQGPDYPGDWTGRHESEQNILAFCDGVMLGEPSTAVPDPPKSYSVLTDSKRHQDLTRYDREMERGGGRLKL